METNKSKIYTIATAHLDTSWLWTLEQTISEYLPDTLKRNFILLEKYPEYKFNFEGSYRYELIKEYYPEEFTKIKNYVKSGRWNPCGACYENGDVNIPSPEALIRNILYGNSFFKNEFGVKSNDIFLPDCFGFGKALPTIAAHSGLTGFSTGKLFWGSSVPIPFDIGVWQGPDGNSIWASLMPFSYTTVFKDMNKAHRVLQKLEDTKKKNLPNFTFAYHGIGDRGGAPHKTSVKNVVKAQRNNKHSDFEVYSSTTKEFFDMLEGMPEEEKKAFPVYDGEFLLTAHGAGSYTSRSVTKRWNRRCELLADAAERFGSAAFINGFSDYPQYGLDNAWKKVIAHHFHDDITGTSFEECYKRSHNDYVQAMNTFSEEYTAACKAVAVHLDTSFVKGIPVIVSNPLQTASSRKEAVSVTVKNNAENFSVFDKNGNEVPSQTKKLSDGKSEITFLADAPSCSLAVYDLRQSKEISSIFTELKLTENCIENKYLTVKIDKNGDISSIFDKRLGNELLRTPVRLALFNNVHSFDWPAWEIKYEDLCESPYTYARNPKIKIKDKGVALCSLEIIRKIGNSEFKQIVSLNCESEYVSVFNETDWREEASLLKAEFNFSSKNEYANYDIGLGYTKRGTNSKNLYEVPAQKWADITDETEEFGVSVFSDSKTGWDKPDRSTLRLTLIHTPKANYRWECSQHIMDMGLNRYSFAIMGHSGKPESVSRYADAFCQPMHTFITDKHEGTLGKEYSFIRLNNDNVRITAIKKAHESDRIIFRVAECSGNDINGVEAEFSLPICEAYTVSGDETELNKIELLDGKLRFDIQHNEIKSFSLVFDKAKKANADGDVIPLDFNAVGITQDSHCHKSELKGGISLPREMLPEDLLFAGIKYSFASGKKNSLICDGREIQIDSGYKSLHLLLASLNGDKTVEFKCGQNSTRVTLPDCFEALGLWDLMLQKETGYIKPVPQALTLSHTHSKNGNLTAKQFYVFHAEIPLDGKNTIKLPDDEDVVIFAATAVRKSSTFIKGDTHFDKLKKREFDYEFSEYAKKLMKPNIAERILDKFFDRTYTVNIKAGEFYNKYALNEVYFILRNLSNKLNYKKNVKKLTDMRKEQEH
ncbi:MAG: alpha-mannosidase [Clostridia bacterium]|nr:alpha-mannosidase [Clostridia bacterium]